MVARAISSCPPRRWQHILIWRFSVVHWRNCHVVLQLVLSRFPAFPSVLSRFFRFLMLKHNVILLWRCLLEVQNIKSNRENWTSALQFILDIFFHSTCIKPTRRETECYIIVLFSHEKLLENINILEPMSILLINKLRKKKRYALLQTL